MANLTQSKERPDKGNLMTYVGVLGTDGTYYDGAILVLNTATGKLQSPTDVAGLPPFGFVQQTTTRAGADVNVVVERMRVELDVAAADQTSVGSPVFCTDEDTFVLTATANKPVGYIVQYLDNGNCMVEMGDLSTSL